MQRLLFVFVLLLPFFARAQEDPSLHIAAGMYTAIETKQYDTTILLALQLKKKYRGTATAERADLCLVQAYLGKDDLRHANRYARKIFRKPAFPGFSRKMTRKCITKHICSELFYRYYESENNAKQAVKYLVKTVDKYPITGCGTGRNNYKYNNYKIIADYYTQLGKTRKAAKYERKRFAIYNHP